MADKKSNNWAVIVYTNPAGENSATQVPLELQLIAGVPVLHYTLECARRISAGSVILILDHEKKSLPEGIDPEINTVVQNEQENLYQVVYKLEQDLKSSVEHLLVIPAGLPLMTVPTLQHLMDQHLSPDPATGSHPVISMVQISEKKPDFPPWFWMGSAPPLQEAAHGAKQGRLAANPGIYCFSSDWFWQAVKQRSSEISRSDPFFDLIQDAEESKLAVQSVEMDDPAQCLRILSLEHLSLAEMVIRQRINQQMMQRGVRIIDPNNTYIDLGVSIGKDSVIYPNTHLRGDTHIGEACQIGPNSLIIDTEIGDRCEVKFAFTESAVLEDDVDIGPFARLRKGAHLAQGVHMGNYGEVKNSYLGPGTKMGHFSYVGDANIGPNVNIGAGVITANYDGTRKYPTEIGAGAFIGSDTMLVAPVKIGAGAHTGAGSVVTKDVPPNSLAVGIPARIISKIDKQDES
jgi:bifunctional UDP-N-acetylglucosamine pyrophosphorylase/glucosamine-1-phosphate N-acetyltransferase